MRNLKFLFTFVTLVVLLSSFGYSQVQVGSTNDDFYGGRGGTASYTSYGSSFNSYYGSNLNTYWPILSNRDECNARQDILVQVSPIGCQPAVVRSDLLAEQNVPVFCQLDLLQINPAIDIKQIRSMRFNGKYPSYVASVGFHPARAALRTRNTLLGSPLESNIGYVVIVLKKNPQENEVPDFFNFTLSATIDYYSGNALGIGATELLLEESSEAEWQTKRYSQSFLKGQYSVRLLDSDPNAVKIGLYKEDIKTSEVSLSREKGQSNLVYLPNSYCQTGLRFSYDEFISNGKVAKIQVDDDVLDLYEGARFLNGQCSVRRIYGDYSNAVAEVSCGRELLKLTTKLNGLTVGTEVFLNGDNSGKKYSITAVKNNKGVLTYSVLAVGDKNLNAAKEYASAQLRPINSKVLFDETYGDNDPYINNATLLYENLADIYGFEQQVDHESSRFYGEVALQEAIELANTWGKKLTASRLIDKYLKLYPDGASARNYEILLSNYHSTDSSLSGATIETADGFHLVKILEIKEPAKVSSARVVWGNQDLNLNFGVSAQTNLGTITLTSVRDQDNIVVNVLCNANIQNNNRPSSAGSINGEQVPLNIRDTTKLACGNNIRVSNIDQQKSIRLRITPETKTSTTSNFTVGIGVDKRLFELTPEKAQKKIENLNKTIKTWESISNNLGNVVKGLKGACFATAGVLTVKNFFTGLSGEALARREAMQGENGWTKICQDEVNRGVEGSGSLTECYNKYSDKISSDVTARTLAIKQTNDVTSAIEKNRKYPNREGLLAGDSFNDVEARKDLIVKIRSECGDVLAPSTDNANRQVSSLLPTGATITDSEAQQYSYSQLRDIYFNCRAVKNGGSAEGVRKARTDLGLIGNSIDERLKYERDVTLYKDVGVFSLDNRNRGTYSGETVQSITSPAKGFTGLPSDLKPDTPVQVVQGRAGNSYLVTLKKSNNGYQTDRIYSLENKAVGELVPGNIALTGAGGAQTPLSGLPDTFDLTTSGTYYNSFAQGETTVRYFETEPYKGMPAVVPFDLNRGFYAATTQSLPLLGQTKSFEGNGRPSSFYVCNIMKDGRIGFYAPNYGDDQCVQFNVYTGQPFTNFPGLAEQETKKVVSDAIKALEEAAQQYGKKTVRIRGNSINVGQAASLIPGTQCQDFMSPEDCKLLFNVCDPVICPATRCDFGGTYRVADVIQSGIVGSALLCLPNYKDGVVLPVCLTGIKAGIDGYLSILKSHQQCLQEAIDTGKYVGICDQINSVYLCEFFWRQAAPLASAVLPKVVEYAYNGGQGNVRGGGEYLTVQSSYQNAEDSVKYFTQSYAVNSIEAFNVRSVAEAGTPFCKAFVSAKGPKSFESLIEPDSPSQFHAWFSTIDYTDATVPATSQYKVFYHIFAGNDRGVSYSVYLKDPPVGAEYSANPIIVVSTGFASKGQYATETKDFTAPKGYKQLCVRINDNEECGFKQVSSSFAINYVRDKVVSDELTRTDIATESQCVSGSVSPLAVLNPNIQEAAQEAIDPDLYNRGVVRICATDNPGRGTDPTRFVQVGSCGSPRLSCWLDKKSVDRAITDSNIGVKNQTLSQLETTQRNSLATQEDILRSDEFASLIRKITDKIKPGLTREQLPTILADLDKLERDNIVVFNKDRATILYFKAKAYAEVFRTLRSKNPNTVATLDSTETVPDLPVTAPVGERFLKLSDLVEPSLNGEYQYVFLLGGKSTNILIEYGGRINLVEGAKKTNLGTLSNGRVTLLSNSQSKIEDTFGDGSFEIIKQRSTLAELVKGINLDDPNEGTTDNTVTEVR